MTEPEPEPKHPYVTPLNGRVHFGFSIVVTVMSIVQVFHLTFVRILGRGGASLQFHIYQ